MGRTSYRNVAASKRELLEDAIRRAGEHLEGLKPAEPTRSTHRSEYPYREDQQLAPWLQAKIADLETALKAHERDAHEPPKPRAGSRRRAHRRA